MHEPENLPAAIDVGHQMPATTELSVGAMMKQVIDQGVTPQNVAAFEKLIDLHLRMLAIQAEKEFNRDFALLQSEIPHIKAMEPVRDKQGVIKYKFAPMRHIMTQLQPHLDRRGFAVSFSTEPGDTDKRIVKICTLTHIGGHSKQTRFPVRVGQGPYGATETQADGSAGEYAKRYALCDALHIIIDKDKDANAEGDSITPEQAESLRQRVADTGSDEKRFLKFAGAATYEEIASGRYAELDSLLRKREPPR